MPSPPDTTLTLWPNSEGKQCSVMSAILEKCIDSSLKVVSIKKILRPELAFRQAMLPFGFPFEFCQFFLVKEQFSAINQLKSKYLKRTSALVDLVLWQLCLKIKLYNISKDWECIFQFNIKSPQDSVRTLRFF